MHKFPSTPHLSNLGTFPIRGDKVLSERDRDEFLSHEIIAEEKVDGANLGISFDNYGSLLLQNRGSIVSQPYMGQWKKMPDWLGRHTDRLFDAIGSQYVVFGEWCYARHSIEYNRLPGWFIGFDVFDLHSSNFLSTQYRDEILNQAGLPTIAEIARGRFQLDGLIHLMRTSSYGDGQCEGLYLRIDDGGWLSSRAKLVHPEFVQSIDTHWSRKALKPNQIVHSWS